MVKKVEFISGRSLSALEVQNIIHLPSRTSRLKFHFVCFLQLFRLYTCIGGVINYL